MADSQAQYVEQLRTKLAGPIHPEQDNYEQRFQLMRALSNVLVSELAAYITANDSFYSDLYGIDFHDMDPEDRDSIEEKIGDVIYSPSELRRHAFRVLSEREDLDITSDSGLLAEFMVRRYMKTRDYKLRIDGSTASAPQGDSAKEVVSGRLLSLLSGTMLGDYMQQAMDSFPELQNEIKQEFGERVRRYEVREGAAESGAEVAEETSGGGGGGGGPYMKMK